MHSCPDTTSSGLLGNNPFLSWLRRNRFPEAEPLHTDCAVVCSPVTGVSLPPLGPWLRSSVADSVLLPAIETKLGAQILASKWLTGHGGGSLRPECMHGGEGGGGGGGRGTNKDHQRGPLLLRSTQSNFSLETWLLISVTGGGGGGPQCGPLLIL